MQQCGEFVGIHTETIRDVDKGFFRVVILPVQVKLFHLFHNLGRQLKTIMTMKATISRRWSSIGRRVDYDLRKIVRKIIEFLFL
jgi:hypothetical protein